MKRVATLALVLIMGLSAPAAVLAEKPVEKLKSRFASQSELNAIIEEIVDQGDSATPDLIALLAEDAPKDAYTARQHWNAKVTAMNIMGETKAKESLDILQDMLENSDDLSAIYNAARTIGNIGGNRAYKILKEVYQNAENLAYQNLNDERLRAAILGMGLCGNKKAIPFLRDALENPNYSQMVRIYAAGSLGLLGSQDGLGIAQAGLSSDDPYVRLAATRALGLIGAASAIPDLNELALPEMDYVYRKSAALSIAQIETGQRSDADKVAFIRDQLIKHPRVTDFIQWGTLKLKKMNTPEAKQALLELAAEDAPEFEVLKHAAKIRAKTMK